MRQRRIFVIVCILALALGAGYVLYRTAIAEHLAQPTDRAAASTAAQAESQMDSAPITHKQSTHRVVASTSSAPLPPRGTPLKDIYDELKARADAGDAQAASRLYSDLQQCARSQELRRALPQLLSQAAEAKATPDQLKRQDANLNFIQTQIDLVHKNEVLCTGLTNDELTMLVPATLEAGQLGDTVATRCYLANEMMMTPGLLTHPEWLTDFRQNALALANSGVQAGDWGTVELLQRAYAGFFSTSFLAQLTGADSVQSYRYLRLERLGAAGDFAMRLDKKLSEAAQPLSADQLSAADAWAQDTFARYFHGTSSNELSNGVNVCQISDN